MIKVRDWIASIPEEEKHIAYVGEGKSTQKEFLLCGDGWETYRDWSFHLDMLFDLEGATLHDQKEVEQTTVNSTKRTEEAAVNTEEITTKETYTIHSKKTPDYEETDIAPLSKSVQQDGIHLFWTVLCQHTQLKGKLRANIRAVGSDTDVVKKSAVMVFEVGESVDAHPALIPSVSEFTQMEAEIDTLRQQTYNAADTALASSETAVMASDIAVRSMQAAQEADRSAVTAAQEAEAIRTDLQHRLLPTATGDDNGKILKLIDGTATWVEHTGGTGGGSTTSLVPRTATGTLVKLTDTKAVGHPLEVVASPTAQKVFVGGKNWFPTQDANGNTLFNADGALIVDDTTKSNAYHRIIDLGIYYPVGNYTFYAKVDTTATDGNTNAAHARCTVRLHHDGTIVAWGDLKVNLGTQQSVRLTIYKPDDGADKSFNKIYLYSGVLNDGSAGIDATYSEVCLYPDTAFSGYVPYAGAVHSLPADGLTVTQTPLYLFADDGSELDVTYYNQVAVSGETDTPDTSVTDTTLPDYYFEDDYLSNKVSAINTLMQTAAVNGDAFIFITDMHTERGSKNGGRTPELLRYLREHTKVRRLFLGGDLAISLPQHTAVSESLAQAFDGDIHYAMGNHEYDTYSAANGLITPRMTEADLYYTYGINKPGQVGNPARHFYYVDNPQQKMRYVVVNNWMHNPDTTKYSDGIKADDIDVQAAWLTHTAFNVEAGWGIVVFCHQFFNAPDATAPSGTATAFMDAIDNYDGDGEILAVFHGHIHRDLINRTKSGVPVIGVTADKTDTSVESVVLVERHIGTISEQAFDVVVVDRTERKLHCIRIGAPAIDGSGAGGNRLAETRVVDFREV